MMIAKEIEAIFGEQDVGDGDVDVDGVIEAFERLKSMATEADLPTLVAAIQSPRNNFWTRELFAEPISQLGGSDYDGFNTHLIEIAYAEPKKCRAKLEELLARRDFKHHEAARWLLEFCKTDKHDRVA